MKVAIGPVFDDFGGVSQHIFGIKRFSSHKIAEVPSKFVRTVLSKNGRGTWQYQKFIKNVEDAQIIPSESKKYVKAFLQARNSLYGTPIAAVRDMSKQIREPVTDVFPVAPQQICHYHFVNNQGKLIFKEKYAAFRKSIVHIRRRTGRTRTTNDMARYGALTAFFFKSGE